MNPRTCLTFAALALALAVGLGAFAAHVLKARLAAEPLAAFHTAVQYQAWHGVGLLVTGSLWLSHPRSRMFAWAARLLASGVVLFCGALYAWALIGLSWLTAFAPLGGAALIAGWVALALALWRELGPGRHGPP